MRNKTISIVALLALAVLLVMPIGCSPSQQAWVERGLQGIELAKENQTAWYEAAVQQVNKDRQRSIGVVFTELELTMERGIPTEASTQPSSLVNRGPTTRPIDVGWIEVQQRTLIATMEAYDLTKRELDDKYQMAMRNLDETGESFVQIQRLNRAWATNRDELAAQMSKLVATVESLKTAKGP